MYLTAEKSKCKRKRPRVRLQLCMFRCGSLAVLYALTPEILHVLGEGPEQLLYGQAPAQGGEEVFKGSVVTSEAGNSMMMV